MLTSLTNKMEQGRDQPWQLSDAPKDYIDRQLKGLIGLEIEIISISGKWKISQNKSAQDQQSVIDQLESLNTDQSKAIAKAIKRG